MSDQSDQLEVAHEQRAHARRATMQDLEAKRPVTREISLVLNEGDDPISLLLQALNPRRWDVLVLKHPPTPEQQAKGEDVNVDTFAPALLALTVVEPSAPAGWWAKRWDDPNWGRGELGSLYFAAQELCNRGLSPAPFVSGSDTTTPSGSN